MPLAFEFSSKTLLESRARWLKAFMLGALGACFLRLFYLQIIQGRTYAAASESNHTQVVVEHAPRGRILDRHGEILADDQPVFIALFSPLGLTSADFQQVVAHLSSILNVSEIELEHRLMAAVKAKSMLRVSDRLTRAQAFSILQGRIHMPGISLAIEEQRYYPKAELASHVLGYVGQITDFELEKYGDEGYRAGDWIGKTGLERLYDPLLHGQDGGILIEVDAHGRQVRMLRHLPPQAGRDLVLTLDAKLEALAQKRLKETKMPGAVVMMNPQNGEVLALASSPAFDPNLFLPLGDSEKRKALLADPSLPLYNRAIQALYPPGSVFKIVSSMAGLEGKKIRHEERVYCPGYYVLGRDRRMFKCWKYPHSHGSVNFHAALAQSCDVYYYTAGLMMGPELIEQYANLFGLGQKTGIDLPNEKKGMLPVAWKTSTRQHWQGGDTLNYVIGQGALQVTPMQLATLVSAVATRGRMWQPYLVAQSRHLGEEQGDVIGSPRLTQELKISDNSWNLLHDALKEVVKTGTGMAAQIKNTVVAGKTGTAQSTKGKDHAWFVAYAPADNPSVACAVVVEHGGHGGSIAAPIAHDLMALALGSDSTPTQESQETD